MKAKTWKSFTDARKAPKEDLPVPVEGPAYTAAQAAAFSGTEGRKAA